MTGSLINNGSFTANADTVVTGSIHSNHLLTVNGFTTFFMLEPVGGDFTLSGSGDFRMVGSFLTGHGGQSSVTDFYNQSKISGSGTIGSKFNWTSYPRDAGYLVIHNTAAGTIEADRSGETLRIFTDLTDRNPVDNQGSMLASGGGTLQFYGHSNALIYVEQSGAGTITALNGSTVNLHNAVVTGGTLHGAGTGVIRSDGSATKLSDLDITRTAVVNAGRSLMLDGAIENRGKIVADGFDCRVTVGAEGLTLSGGGLVTLVGNYGTSRIVGEALGTVLTNVNNTIAGKGEIAGGNLTLVNDGKISARPDSYSAIDSDVLSLDPLAGLTNTGVLEAVGLATLSIGSLTADNTAGVIQAIGAGSKVVFNNLALSGGVLHGTGGGVIEAAGSRTHISDLSTTATAVSNTGRQVTFEGAIKNAGQIVMNDFNGYLNVGADGLTLTGGGCVVLRDNYDTSHTVGEAAGAVLTNVDNVISGDGAIVGANLSVINGGTIRADEDPYGGLDSLVVDDLTRRSAAAGRSRSARASRGLRSRRERPAAGSSTSTTSWVAWARSGTARA